MKKTFKTAYGYRFNDNAEQLTRDWNSLIAKQDAWKGSPWRAFSLSFGA